MLFLKKISILAAASHPLVRWSFQSSWEFLSRNRNIMRKAVGFLIVLWGLSHFFQSSVVSLDDAARESFKLIETAALASQQHLIEKM